MRSRRRPGRFSARLGRRGPPPHRSSPPARPGPVPGSAPAAERGAAWGGAAGAGDDAAEGAAAARGLGGGAGLRREGVLHRPRQPHHQLDRPPRQVGAGGAAGTALCPGSGRAAGLGARPGLSAPFRRGPGPPSPAALPPSFGPGAAVPAARPASVRGREQLPHGARAERRTPCGGRGSGGAAAL